MFPRISSSSFLIGYRSVCSPKSSTQSNYHNCSCVRQRSLAPVRIDDMRMPSNPFAQSRDHFAEVETGLKRFPRDKTFVLFEAAVKMGPQSCWNGI